MNTLNKSLIKMFFKSKFNTLGIKVLINDNFVLQLTQNLEIIIRSNPKDVNLQIEKLLHSKGIKFILSIQDEDIEYHKNNSNRTKPDGRCGIRVYHQLKMRQQESNKQIYPLEINYEQMENVKKNLLTTIPFEINNISKVTSHELAQVILNKGNIEKEYWTSTEFQKLYNPDNIHITCFGQLKAQKMVIANELIQLM